MPSPSPADCFNGGPFWESDAEGEPATLRPSDCLQILLSQPPFPFTHLSWLWVGKVKSYHEDTLDLHVRSFSFCSSPFLAKNNGEQMTSHLMQKQSAACIKKRQKNWSWKSLKKKKKKKKRQLPLPLRQKVPKFNHQVWSPRQFWAVCTAGSTVF